MADQLGIPKALGLRVVQSEIPELLLLVSASSNACGRTMRSVSLVRGEVDVWQVADDLWFGIGDDEAVSQNDSLHVTA